MGYVLSSLISNFCTDDILEVFLKEALSGRVELLFEEESFSRAGGQHYFNMRWHTHYSDHT